MRSRNRHDEVLGELGERIVGLGLVDKFGPESVRKIAVGSKGADYLVVAEGLRVFFEVKFYIRTGNHYFGFQRYKEQIQERFEEFRTMEEAGFRFFLILLGKKPRNWGSVSGWCLRDDIWPFFLPINERALEMLSKYIGETESTFDVPLFASTCYDAMRPQFRLVLSLIANPFRELTENEWRSIQPIVDKNSRGRRRTESKKVVNGLLYAIATNTKIEDLPRDRYATDKTTFRDFEKWRSNGDWERILETLASHRYGTA